MGVEWFDEPTSMGRLSLRRSRLAELARFKVDADEVYEALYEITAIALPLEDELDDYLASSARRGDTRARCSDP